MGDSADDSSARCEQQHPLPPEILQMSRDETICRYCGVSYLIHNEIKALEAKLKECEQKLAHLQGGEQREAELTRHVTEARNELSACKLQATGAETTVYKLRAELLKTESDLKTQNDSLQKVTKSLNLYRQKHAVFEQTLPTFLKQLAAQRDQLKSLREAVAHSNEQLILECGNMTALVAKTIKQSDDEKMRSSQQATSLQKQIVALLGEAEDMRRHLAAAEESAKEQSTKLTARVKELESENNNSAQKTRQLLLETDHFKEQIKKQTLELEQVRGQARHAQFAADEMITQLYKEGKGRETALRASEAETMRLRQAYEDGERVKEATRMKMSASDTHTETIQRELSRAQRDMEALKAERDMMITAHQNQIEQLRESFRTRSVEIEMWPIKLDKAVSEAKRQHETELTNLEKKLSDNYYMEMQIEKQKHDQLVEKYATEIRHTSVKVKAALSGDHQRALAQLHAQLAELKARGCETERASRQEVCSLKNIINDLEGRLGKLTIGSSESTDQWTQKVTGLRSELTVLRGERDQLDAQSRKSAEQVAFLQETVRRECEERFELTEALSEVKEELLSLKRPAGGYSSSSSHKTSAWPPEGKDGGRPTANGSFKSRAGLVATVVAAPPGGNHKKLSSSSGSSGGGSSGVGGQSTARSKEMTVYRKAKRRSVGDVTPDRAKVTAGHYGNRAAAVAAAVGGRGARGGSLTDSRKRIAAAVMKRNSNAT